jgi:excisionase family DNA binding protein
MKPRDLQFDVRKSPDSQRVHGLRLGLSSSSKEQPIGLGNAQAEVRSMSEPRMVETFQLPLSEKANEATGTGRRESTRLLTVEEVASLLHVPVSWVYGRMRKTALERIPAYRVGKYWRFRAEEVMAWLLDSSRRPGPDQMV